VPHKTNQSPLLHAALASFLSWAYRHELIDVTPIDGPPGLDLSLLVSKSVSWHWELMFTRSMYNTPDLIEQQRLLARAADLFDAGALSSTLTTTLEGFTPANLRRAHEIVESGHAIGKVVVAR